MEILTSAKQKSSSSCIKHSRNGPTSTLTAATHPGYKNQELLQRKLTLSIPAPISRKMDLKLLCCLLIVSTVADAAGQTGDQASMKKVFRSLFSLSEEGTKEKKESAQGPSTSDRETPAGTLGDHPPSMVHFDVRERDGSSAGGYYCSGGIIVLKQSPVAITSADCGKRLDEARKEDPRRTIAAVSVNGHGMAWEYGVRHAAEFKVNSGGSLDSIAHWIAILVLEGEPGDAFLLPPDTYNGEKLLIGVWQSDHEGVWKPNAYYAKKHLHHDLARLWDHYVFTVSDTYVEEISGAPVYTMTENGGRELIGILYPSSTDQTGRYYNRFSLLNLSQLTPFFDKFNPKQSTPRKSFPN